MELTALGADADFPLLPGAPQGVEKQCLRQQAVIRVHDLTEILGFEFAPRIAGHARHGGIQIDEVAQRIAEKDEVVGAIQDIAQGRGQVVRRMLRQRRRDHDPGIPARRRYQNPLAAPEIAAGSCQPESPNLGSIGCRCKQRLQRGAHARRDEFFADSAPEFDG